MNTGAEARLQMDKISLVSFLKVSDQIYLNRGSTQNPAVLRVAREILAAGTVAREVITLLFVAMGDPLNVETAKDTDIKRKCAGSSQTRNLAMMTRPQEVSHT